LAAGGILFAASLLRLETWGIFDIHCRK
jgi:hypothetical protein